MTGLALPGLIRVDVGAMMGALRRGLAFITSRCNQIYGVEELPLMT